MDKQYQRKKKNSDSLLQQLGIQNQYTFQNQQYVFPNDLNVCKKYNSFMTQFKMQDGDISDQQTKRLSKINRCSFVIKLKQIKKSQMLDQVQKYQSKYLLYYENVPYSFRYAHAGFVDIVQNIQVDTVLRQALRQLTSLNIPYQFSPENTGFNQKGQCKLYVSPLIALSQQKLSSQQKYNMNMGVNNLINFWKTKKPKPKNSSPYRDRVNNSYKFPDVLPKQNQNEIDIKKTIKMSKNYAKQPSQQPIFHVQDSKPVTNLKKARSLETQNSNIASPSNKNGLSSASFMKKIQQINKRIVSIRGTFFKKSQNSPQNKVQKNYIYQKNPQNSKVIDDKYKQKKSNKFQQIQKIRSLQCLEQKKYQTNFLYDKNAENKNYSREQDQESVDTYYDQLGQDFYTMPKITPSYEYQKATMGPASKQRIVQSIKSNTNWHHSSHGNKFYKRIQAQLEKDKSMLEEQKEDSQHSNMNSRKSCIKSIKAKQADIYSSIKSGKQSLIQLKRMISSKAFEGRKQLNFSGHRKELSADNKKQQQIYRHQQIKKKVNDILAKSKNAIRILKSPLNLKTKQ